MARKSHQATGTSSDKKMMLMKLVPYIQRKKNTIIDGITFRPHMAPVTSPQPCDTNVTRKNVIKNKQTRNSSSGCDVIKYVITT